MDWDIRLAMHSKVESEIPNSSSSTVVWCVLFANWKVLMMDNARVLNALCATKIHQKNKLWNGDSDALLRNSESKPISKRYSQSSDGVPSEDIEET
jgi:hypothetical protein